MNEERKVKKFHRKLLSSFKKTLSMSPSLLMTRESRERSCSHLAINRSYATWRTKLLKWLMPSLDEAEVNVRIQFIKEYLTRKREVRRWKIY